MTNENVDILSLYDLKKVAVELGITFQDKISKYDLLKLIDQEASVTTNPYVCIIPDLITDQRLKNYFSRKYKHLVRFVPGIGWHFWDRKRWCTNLPGGLHPLIDSMQRHLLEEARNIEDDKQRIERMKTLIGLECHKRQLKLIQACEHVPSLITDANQLDSDPMLLNCQNGTIDLRTGSLKIHNPTNLITRIINVEYDPSATCQTFQQFITWAMQGDLELVAYLQRFIG
jgi:putative DNA primase/helicase